MRIAVIGKGNIGGSLGTKWRAAGHDVVYGARNGSGEGPGGAPVRGIGDALKDVDVVVLAVPGQVVADVVTGHGAALAGKTVIDAVNRIGARVRQQGDHRGCRAAGPLRPRVQLAGLGELRRSDAGHQHVLRGGPGRQGHCRGAHQGGRP